MFEKHLFDFIYATISLHWKKSWQKKTAALYGCLGGGKSKAQWYNCDTT